MALPDSRAGRDRANQSVVAGVGDPGGRWARLLSEADKSEECQMLRFDRIWPRPICPRTRIGRAGSPLHAAARTGVRALLFVRTNTIYPPQPGVSAPSL